jgi:hypothetical protein
MNTSPKIFVVLLIVFIAVALLDTANAKPPPVTLTVTPSVISNTYPGVITLNITSLTNTENVTIQRWLDLNGNGSIDAGEPMIDAFKITDNNITNALIGGITNINVPFDTNTINGVITTTLNCPAAMLFDTMVGQYVFQVVSPTGRFSPVTATFAVTNATPGQSVSGIIYSNGIPFPHAVVVAKNQLADGGAAAVSDSSGHYFLTLPPGSYNLIAAMPNLYDDLSSAPSVILTNGMSATNNLFLTNGAVTISGSVYDAANSNGIGGLMLTLQSGDLLAVAFTDTNGNYSAAVTPAFWTIQPLDSRLARRAYVLPQTTFQVDTTGGNVTNANIALPRGNALFYGRITDSSSAPFANVEITGYSGNAYNSRGYSDQNGYYAVAILGDLTNYWSCNVYSGKSTALGNYVVNSGVTTTNSPNQTTLDNFVALPVTAQISGHVQDNSGNAVAGVGLNANSTINGNYYHSLDGTTDDSGNYSLAVASGQWSVEFIAGNSSGSLETHGFVDITAPHVVAIPPTNAVLNITVYPPGTPFITSPQRFGTMQFGFLVNGATNVSYTVQVSTNLASTNWTPLFSLTLTTNTFQPVVDYNATNSLRYYRVLKN